MKREYDQILAGVSRFIAGILKTQVETKVFEPIVKYYWALGEECGLVKEGELHFETLERYLREVVESQGAVDVFGFKFEKKDIEELLGSLR